MAIDFSNQLKLTERTINRYINKKLPVPTAILDKYSNLQSFVNSSSGAGGNNSSTISGNLQIISKSTLSITTSEELVPINSNINYILIQNNGPNNIYFTFGSSGVLDGSNSLILLPGASWTSSIPQFIQNNIYGQATVSSTVSIVVYYIAEV